MRVVIIAMTALAIAGCKKTETTTTNTTENVAVENVTTTSGNMVDANMTNAAYDKNIELGVLCRGGSTAARVQRHFDALIARGVLCRSEL